MEIPRCSLRGRFKRRGICVTVNLSPQDERPQLSLTFLASLFYPFLDWIQVEVTSACNAACTYCPHTVYRNIWKERHLSLDLFKKLVPAFHRTCHVHLQGWGEPLLHPHFLDLVDIAKAAGCRVGTTTNGMLLGENSAGHLVESGLDVVAFSLAGVDARNDAVRKGTRLKTVLNAMGRLRAEKERRQSKTPEIHVAYLLLRSGLEDLEKIPGLLADAGAEQVVVSTLDFVPSQEWDQEALLPTDGKEPDGLSLRLGEVVRQGKSRGLLLHHYLDPANRESGVCTENVGRALCIASDGSVTPCVFTNLDVSASKYLSAGKATPYRRWVFGNIRERSLRRIWREKTYRAFRRSFSGGNLWPPCRHCPKRKHPYPYPSQS